MSKCIYTPSKDFFNFLEPTDIDYDDWSEYDMDEPVNSKGGWGRGGITCEPGSDSWIRMTQHGKYNLSPEGRAAIRKANCKPKSDETKAKMSEAVARQPRVKCPHCDVTGRASNMNRWHFNNCKKVYK